MKYLKIFEEKLINYPHAIDEQIDFIIKPWKEILRIRNVVTHYETKLTYMNIFEDINEKTFKDFNDFFNALKKFDLYFKQENKNFRIDSANMNKRKLKIEMDKEKYNL